MVFVLGSDGEEVYKKDISKYSESNHAQENHCRRDNGS
jgi:hypothetical protein